jgi:hypothetical protein
MIGRDKRMFFLVILLSNLFFFLHPFYTLFLFWEKRKPVLKEKTIMNLSVIPPKDGVNRLKEKKDVMLATSISSIRPHIHHIYYKDARSR